MNTDMLYATLRDDTRHVKVHFNTPALYIHNDGTGPKTHVRSSQTQQGQFKKYSYKALLSQNLAPGDVVVVTVGEGELKLAMVAEVLDINTFDKSIDEVKWVVGSVNRQAVDRVLQQEEDFRLRIQTAQNATARRKALEEIAVDNNLAVDTFAEFDGMAHLNKLLAAPEKSGVLEG